MKRYLVPYDGSEFSAAALRYAVQFAENIPGHIDIVYVADERLIANPIFDFTVLALQAVGALGDLIHREKAKLELKAKIIAHGEDLLEDLQQWPELAPDNESPTQYSTRVEVTNPPVYLSDADERFDVVFLGLWGEGGDQKGGIWGSTSDAVIRRGTSIVLLAKGDFRPIDSIIIGFDNRPRSRQALAWAGMIGENMKIPVTVLTGSSDRDWAEEVLGTAREIAPSYETEFSFESSDKKPADAILDLSNDKPGALICLGAFGDQPLREFFLGSVADEVLRRANAPVMLYK